LARAAANSIFGTYPNSCQPMDESKRNKFETYWDVTLMFCYFWIPFFGMKRALKMYTATEDLPFMSILLLLFISGNILTWMILLLNDKTLRAKTLWTVVLLFIMIVLNVLVM
jgi:dolichyl-phosphate-mannose--protein O-mannosyl transferase